MIRQRAPFLLVTTLVLASLVQGCEPEPEEALLAETEERSSGDVSGARGASAGPGAPRALRPRLRLGVESHATEQLLYRPKSVVIDERHRIFVLDNDNGRIAVYSKDGAFLNGIGRSGPGPGEFEGSPNVLDDLALAGDLLAAFEGPTRRVQVFTTDGTFVTSFAKRLGSSSIAIAGERIYTSTAGREGNDGRIEVFSLAGELVDEFGEGGVGDAASPREARRLNRSVIAVAASSGEVGRAYQYTPILRIYSRDGVLKAETTVELKESSQPRIDPPGVSLAERTVHTLVARDIEYVEPADTWVVLLADGVVRSYAGRELNEIGDLELLRPEGLVIDDQTFGAAAALDIGVSPNGDFLCATVAAEHEVWCYDVR